MLVLTYFLFPQWLQFCGSWNISQLNIWCTVLNMIYWSWPFLLCHDLKGKGGIKAGAVTLIGEFNLCKHNVYPGQSDWTHAYHNTLNFVKMLSFYLLLFLRILIQGMQTLIINRGDPTSSLHLVSPRSGI